MLNRLFGNRGVDPETAERIPPGQYLTEKFPVLHYGSVPETDLARWDFRAWGEVDSPFTLTWEQLRALPRKAQVVDIHCVTRWSKLGTTWEGVPIRAILDLARVRPNATHVVAHCEQGYTTNLPLAGPRRRGRPARRHLRREAAGAGARLPAPPARPQALLLEEREVAPRARVPRPRRARLLGALRLPQRWRPLEGGALQRRVNAQVPERGPGRQATATASTSRVLSPAARRRPGGRRHAGGRRSRRAGAPARRPGGGTRHRRR